MSRGYAKDRPSPAQSATWYDIGTEREGGDGNIWHVSADTRGIKRWKKGHGTEKRTDTLIKDPIDGDIDMEEKPTHEGLGSLFDRGPTEESPMHEEDTTPEEVVEVERDTVMSKLRGSVNVPEEFKFADDSTFYTMLRNIYRGKNILITGPSGCGKSSLGKILAEITAKEFYSFNFGDTMNPSAKLLGDTKYDKEEGTWFKPSRFVNAIQADSFIMLDEVTRDRTGDLANILMPVLDGQKYLALDESEDSDSVSVNPSAFFYATANIGREYLGASHDLDRAWKDRFTGGIYELEYLPPQKEKELIMNRNPQLKELPADRIVDFAKRVRDLYSSDELSTAVSTRMCLAVAELVVDGMTLVDALKHTCLPFYPVQAGDDTERVRILQVIQSMGE
jgi:MoxR-like ATPase